MEFDVAIIGGGLAGLSSARAIFQKGELSVCVIEGDDFGANNPTPLTFIDILNEYDLQDCIKEWYSTFVFHNDGGSTVEYSFSDSPLVALDYKKACQTIFNKIKSKNKLIHIKEYATEIKRISGALEVHLKSGNHVKCRILIDASGKAQFASNIFGLHKENRFYSHVFGGYFSGVRGLEKNKACYLLPNKELGSGGGWFYSINKNTASFGYAHITTSKESDDVLLKDIFKKALSTFKPYSDYLHNAHMEHMEKGVIPITNISSFVLDNIIVVGDSAGIATNWMCMGIEPALKYGGLAGIITAESLLNNDFNHIFLYQEQWEKENRATFDDVAKQATTFWESDGYFWEWIIKNDLAYLTPDQMLGRMRRNDFLIKKHQIFLRALRYKIKCMLNKKASLPEQISIS